MTLQGQSEVKSKTPYVCGKYHQYVICWYLDSSLAPSDWKENPTTHKIIDKQLKKPEKKVTVERAFKKKENTGMKSDFSKEDEVTEISHQGFALSAFTTADEHDKFSLHNSFILDSGADTHVCNNTTRATRPIRPASPGECLTASNSWIL